MTNKEAIDILRNAAWLGTHDERERIEKAVDMAINALTAQPKKRTEERTETHTCDCISRQAAIDALDRIFDRCEEIEAHLPEGDPDRTGYKMYPDYMTVWKYMHQLPTAQPERRWIPCSERLPEERQEILATTTDNAWGDVMIIRTYYKEMHKSVIAWMPLPECYREGEG